ncbi:hypothetical protein JCM9533A_58060 [Catenuloplanes niger JCM 9533]|uniref:Uncharacterized protein n=1 Tax=Catenuloplanes niger TaxID=587534 RepID=A0AAE3ZSL3_9ACTN|nr:hypothetical protein [Catenuloplanes niger]
MTHISTPFPPRRPHPHNTTGEHPQTQPKAPNGSRTRLISRRPTPDGSISGGHPLSGEGVTTNPPAKRPT